MAQRYATHRRYSPLFHFVVTPILLVNLGFAIRALMRAPGAERWWGVVMAVGLVLLSQSARQMVLTVQNRVIRLEQRLRLGALLPPDLAARVGELRLGQLLALRFASDAEVAELVRRCLGGELRTADAVKREIREWQGDYLRA